MSFESVSVEKDESALGSVMKQDVHSSSIRLTVKSVILVKRVLCGCGSKLTINDLYSQQPSKTPGTLRISHRNKFLAQKLEQAVSHRTAHVAILRLRKWTNFKHSERTSGR